MNENENGNENIGEQPGGHVREHSEQAANVYANTDGHVREQDGEYWHTVKEAAARLGVGERAVQRRVDRGTLRSKQDGNRLLVCFDSVPDRLEPRGEQANRDSLPSGHVREHGEHGEHQSEHTDGHVREHANANRAAGEHAGERVREHQAGGEQADEHAANSPNREQAALVAHLHSEIDFLRAELTAQRQQHAIAESEMRRLMLADRAEIAQLRQQLALTAGPVVVDGAELVSGQSVSSVTIERQTDADKPMPNTQHWTPDAAALNTQSPTVQNMPEAEPSPDAVQAAAQGGKLEVDGGNGRADREPMRPWWMFWKRKQNYGEIKQR